MKKGKPWSGLQKTGIRGIKDTRQIVDRKTNDIENSDKKVGPNPLHKTTHEKSNCELTLINKPSISSVRHPWTHGHKIWL